MANRLLRTNTIANIADFSAQSPGVAATNAQAFRNALAVSRRIAIPAGIWNLQDILYQGNPWLPPEVEIFGEGLTQTFINYSPLSTVLATTVPAFWFHTGAGGLARSTVRDLRINGPVANGIDSRPVGVGIRFDRGLLCRVRDVSIWDLEVGVDFNLDALLGYSAHHMLERFEINRCITGIRARDASNACTVQNGRIFYSLYQTGNGAGSLPITSETGIGIDIQGTTSTFGPAGTSGFVVQGVNIEPAVTCLRVVNAHQTTVMGGYFEPGTPPNGFPRRRIYDIAGSASLVLLGNNESEGGVGTLPPENWTPSYLDAPPEERTEFTGASIPTTSDQPTFVTGRGAARSGATAPHANRIKNADMSRGTMFWPTTGTGLITPNQTPFVTGGASTRLKVQGDTQFRTFQNVTLDTGVRAVTVAVRYQLVNAIAHALLIELHDLDTPARLGYYYDTRVGPSGWTIRTLTGRFDQLGPGVVGPRRIQVRVYPYAGSTPPNGQQVLVDSVWLVDGEYGAPFRPYTDGLELLRADDRQTFFSGTTTVNVGPVSAMPTLVPSNAIGMVVEIQVRGTQATSQQTILRVDDNEGTDQVRDVHAFVNDRPTIVEYTLPVTPGGTQPQWSVIVTNPANSVTYAVRLKKWLLRP